VFQCVIQIADMRSEKHGGFAIAIARGFMRDPSSPQRELI
jgi:hypothetical protein